MRILFLNTPINEELTGSLYRAAEALGMRCEYFDLAAARRAAEGDTRSRVLRRLRRLCGSRAIGESLLKQFGSERFDLILQVKGVEYSPRTLQELKRRVGAPLFNYYPDSPICPSSTSRNLLRSIPITDVFFTFTEEFVSPLRSRGCPRVEVLPFARDETLHAPATLTAREKAELSCEISFVGSWSEDREFWLSQITDRRLGVWGPAANGLWARALGRFYRGGPADSNLTSKIFAASSITINVVRPWDDLAARPRAHDAERYWGTGHNMRSFEALACGAFVLSSRTRNLERLFQEGKEIECFASVEELRQKVDFYLMNDSERARIAEAGRRRVEFETYRSRFSSIINLYEDWRRTQGTR